MSKHNYVSIQYLRALAALMVVFHHTLMPNPSIYNPLGDIRVGAYGVEIFFVISGFIIYTAARNEKILSFFARRIIRVVPLYWLATLGFVAFDIALGLFKFSPEILISIIKSLLFIPHYKPELYQDIWPYLVPGWTLNYEIFFYFLFGLAAFASQLRLPVLIAAIIALVFLGHLIDSDNAIFLTYTNPLILLFAAGVLLGWANIRFQLHAWVAALFPLGLVGILISDGIENPLLRLLPAIALVAGAVAIERNIQVPPIPILKLLGDASYSIYLSHMVVVRLSLNIFSKILPYGMLQFILMVASIMIVSCVLGVAIHILAEKPLIRILSGWFVPRRTLDLRPAA